jgi:hypothetical protein
VCRLPSESCGADRRRPLRDHPLRRNDKPLIEKPSGREGHMKLSAPRRLGMRKTHWPCVLIALAVAGVAAQDKPDFSGRWVLEDPLPATADTPRALTVRQSLVRTSARGTPMEPFFKDLIVDREFETEVRSETHHIGIVGGVVGGMARGAQAPSKSPQSRFSVTWEGNRLVIETGTYSGPTREDGPYRERTEVWSLDTNGRLVLAVTSRSSEASTTQSLRYRRE